MASRSVPPVMENAVSQLHQCTSKQHPQRDAHHADPQVYESLQVGAQNETEGQLEQQGRQVPQPLLQALLTIPLVKVRLAASDHLNDQHEDEDGVKSPNGEKNEKPVPVDLGVQLEDQHDEEDEGKEPREEHSLDQ